MLQKLQLVNMLLVNKVTNLVDERLEFIKAELVVVVEKGSCTTGYQVLKVLLQQYMGRSHLNGRLFDK